MSGPIAFSNLTVAPSASPAFTLLLAAQEGGRLAGDQTAWEIGYRVTPATSSDSRKAFFSSFAFRGDPWSQEAA